MEGDQCCEPSEDMWDPGVHSLAMSMWERFHSSCLWDLSHSAAENQPWEPTSSMMWMVKGGWDVLRYGWVRGGQLEYVSSPLTDHESVGTVIICTQINVPIEGAKLKKKT